MELIVRQGEREEAVRIERDRRDGQERDRYRVTIGETVHTVEARRLRDRDALWSLIVDGTQHEVGVRRGRGERYTVSTLRATHAVEVTDPLTHLAREAHGAAAGGGFEAVAAYMPGRVVAVLVEEGDEVEAGQGVVVLEAMKMENEIATERAGRIGKIHVEAGQAVEGGDPLFELGPPE